MIQIEQHAAPPSDSLTLPFAEAAPYYRKYRAPYAREVFPYLCEELRLSTASRALDLGAGSGAIAIPLSALIAEVVAVDPDAAMLAEGRLAGEQAGRHNIDWRCTRAEEFSAPVDSFDIVTMGQSFHWLDRDLVLRNLAPMIRAGGGLALIAPSHHVRAETSDPIVNAVVERYIGAARHHPSRNPELPNELSLLRSHAFSRFYSRCFIVEFERDVSSIIGQVYPMSSSPRSRFGSRISDFERELGTALLEANPSGVFKERIETEVVIAAKLS
jgi:SAM-dependent methyltransferase